MNKVLAFILALTACTGDQPEVAPAAPQVAAPIPVRLALNWYPEPEFGGFYEGLLGGHYADAGFAVEIIPGGSGAPTLELLSSGRVEVAISAADDLLVKRSKGIAAIGAWPAFQLNPQGLMVHAASGIRGYDGIPAGSRIAIEQGAPFQQYLWKRFDWQGKVEPVPYGGSVGPFLADAKLIQQAYITSEPCVARGKGAEISFLGGSTAGWNPYGTLVAFSDPPPEWAGRFVAATQKAWEAYLADPSRANAEIGRRNDQLDANLLACITEAQAPFLTGDAGLGKMDAARWQETADALVSIGLLPEGSRADGAWRSF